MTSDPLIEALDAWEALDPGAAKDSAFADLYEAGKKLGWPDLREGEVLAAYAYRRKIATLEAELLEARREIIQLSREAGEWKGRADGLAGMRDE